MELLTANQAKTQFGSTLIKAQREPVQVNKNGKPVVVIVSAESYVAPGSDAATVLAECAERAMNAAEDELTDLDEFMAEIIAGKHD